MLPAPGTAQGLAYNPPLKRVLAELISTDHLKIVVDYVITYSK